MTRTEYPSASTAHRIEHTAYDYAGEPMTGLITLFVRIYRPADGFFWNWTTGAFVSAPAPGDRDKTLLEVSASLMPGTYAISWPGDVAGYYIAYIEQSGTGTDYNAPETIRLVVGSLATAAAVAAVQTSATDLQARTPTALVSGRMPAVVQAMDADVIGAAAVAAAAVSKVQNGLATAAAVATLPTASEIATTVDAALSLSHGGTAWTTATGFSTHSAADVWLAAGRTLTGIGGSGIASQASVDALPAAPSAADVIAAMLAEPSPDDPEPGTLGETWEILRGLALYRLETDTVGGGREVLYRRDATTAWLTWPLRDPNGNAIRNPAGSVARRGAAT